MSYQPRRSALTREQITGLPENWRGTLTLPPDFFYSLIGEFPMGFSQQLEAHPFSWQATEKNSQETGKKFNFFLFTHFVCMLLPYSSPYLERLKKLLKEGGSVVILTPSRNEVELNFVLFAQSFLIRQLCRDSHYFLDKLPALYGYKTIGRNEEIVAVWGKYAICSDAFVTRMNDYMEKCLKETLNDGIIRQTDLTEEELLKKVDKRFNNSKLDIKEMYAYIAYDVVWYCEDFFRSIIRGVVKDFPSVFCSEAGKKLFHHHLVDYFDGIENELTYLDIAALTPRIPYFSCITHLFDSWCVGYSLPLWNGLLNVRPYNSDFVPVYDEVLYISCNDAMERVLKKTMQSTSRKRNGAENFPRGSQSKLKSLSRQLQRELKNKEIIPFQGFQNRGRGNKLYYAFDEFFPLFCDFLLKKEIDKGQDETLRELLSPLALPARELLYRRMYKIDCGQRRVIPDDLVMEESFKEMKYCLYSLSAITPPEELEKRKKLQ